MTDRELLERAAKAAGFVFDAWSDEIKDYDSPHHGLPALHKSGAGGQCHSWNPLAEDGDALRLAVALQLLVAPAYGMTTSGPEAGGTDCTEPHKDDPYAATRRAIVRAAATLGECAKPPSPN